jgi:hypothetical protein
MLPESLQVWDGAEFSLSEFLRLAVCRENLYAEPEEEFYALEKAGESHLESKLLFDEWERSDRLGMLTMVPLPTGLIDILPRRAFEFIELDNASPR